MPIRRGCAGASNLRQSALLTVVDSLLLLLLHGGLIVGSGAEWLYSMSSQPAMLGVQNGETRLTSLFGAGDADNGWIHMCHSDMVVLG